MNRGLHACLCGRIPKKGAPAPRSGTPPDGHTVLVTSSSFVVNPSIYKKLPYDTVRDFLPVSQLAEGEAHIIVVNPSLPARTVKEPIALAGRPGAKLAYGSPGVGNTIHLVSALFNLRAGTQIESGLTGTEMPPSWHGMLAPAKTPPAVLAKLAAEVQKAVKSPQTQERIVAIGLEPVGSTPEAFRKLFASNIKRFAELVKLAGVEPE